MPAFDGIITERASDLLPPDFRTRLPPRVVESGRIFKAINGLERIYETKGSGAGPEMLRTEMGVMYVHNLGDTLAQQDVELDAVLVDVTVPGGSTTTPTSFSFGTMPFSGGTAGNHRILAASIRVADAQVANFDHADLLANQFGDPSQAHLGWATAASLDALGGGFQRATFRGLEQGVIIGRPNEDYQFRVRSNAGGGTTARLELLVAISPPGLAVPT